MAAEKPLIFAPPTYQYEKGQLNEADINSNPLTQFHKWFHEAQQTLPEGLSAIPESVVFSTARLPEGRISSRVVLLKELDPHGFIVYSNWGTSKKSKDYSTNKHASLTFFWSHIQRQVRVEGVMEKVTRETSERYFKTRPRGLKIGAWASPQSEVIQSRGELDVLYKSYEEKFADLADDEIPCPDFWGGVRIVPLEIEFWQGGVSRLHDRLTFTREKTDGEWAVKRISP
ncbi:pyridoxamine 5'-phosphate oxidase [Metschnikowia bicuspidata var. bicuspidata NRRL YB-4993]|uniref:pyridoxal 5'-phosphate synthase n=1 Tax=Metschnikowia bicuspidata var. bicuspidata NRRL YB-4993 TaxID=869754 RepID=A0A1A0HD06_9ASCO|nr:pyridoxamine 5'-phosphate oxidase [Metschnikowia bicuspidata var. bicuspidata NRRL YB-4993]OBA21823.1 pyridoxamine 5'-phosphate oxidase [Metschnikowia bicuspidata var. bicuspidata NRRL YB-4993]